MKIEYSADGSTAFYCGYKFRRDPNTGYFLCTKNTDAGNRERLHRFVWRTNNGEIPDGYDVHHIDGNKRNNNLENLKCIPRFDHLSFHANEQVKNHYDRMIQNLTENARPKASEWHRSTDGRKWHSEQAKITVANMKEKEYVCQCCGKKFYKKPLGENKFCSNNCKSAYRRKLGVDNETRICAMCGKPFITNKYAKVKTCSLSCAGYLRWNKRDQETGQAAGI